MNCTGTKFPPNKCHTKLLNINAAKNEREKGRRERTEIEKASTIQYNNSNDRVEIFVQHQCDQIWRNFATLAKG